MTALSRMTDPSNGTSLSWLTASLLSLLRRWELSYLFPHLLFFSFFPLSHLIPNSQCFFFVFLSHYHVVGKVHVRVKKWKLCDGVCVCVFVSVYPSLHTICVCAYVQYVYVCVYGAVCIYTFIHCTVIAAVPWRNTKMREDISGGKAQHIDCSTN